MATSISRDEAVRNIVFALFASFLTCGIYNLYWNSKQMKTFNSLLEREEFHFWTWLIVSVLTCGIYHVYYQYKMARGLVEIQESCQLRVDEGLPLLSILLTLFGLSIVVDAIQQNEINKIFESLPITQKPITP